MKKLIVFLLVFLVLVISFGGYYYSVRKDYKTRLGKSIEQWQGYSSLVELWRDYDGIFPSSMEEMYVAYQEEFSDEREMYYFELRNFRDFFSSTDRWLLYVPLYGEDNDTIQSYLFVSAGVDGKLDNDISGKKLTMSNWKEELRLYNPDEFEPIEKEDGQSVNSEDLEFSLWDYLFGKKDLLIFERDKIIMDIPSEDSSF